MPCGGFPCGIVRVSAGGTTLRDGRDTGLHGACNGFEVRLAFDPGIEEEVIKLSFSAVVLQEAENQLKIPTNRAKRTSDG